jgi:hypothetical protein
MTDSQITKNFFCSSVLCHSVFHFCFLSGSLVQHMNIVGMRIFTMRQLLRMCECVFLVYMELSPPCAQPTHPTPGPVAGALHHNLWAFLGFSIPLTPHTPHMHIFQLICPLPYHRDRKYRGTTYFPYVPV